MKDLTQKISQILENEGVFPHHPGVRQFLLHKLVAAFNEEMEGLAKEVESQMVDETAAPGDIEWGMIASKNAGLAHAVNIIRSLSASSLK